MCRKTVIETKLVIIALFISFELYEIYWQKAESMMGMLNKMHRYYKKNILLFLLMHPTYYYTIFLLLLFDEISPIAVILFIKTLDIATKILLIEQIYYKKRISQEMAMLLLTPLHPFLPYMGLFLYVPFLVMGLYM